MWTTKSSKLARVRDLRNLPSDPELARKVAGSTTTVSNSRRRASSGVRKEYIFGVSSRRENRMRYLVSSSPGT